MKRYENHDDGYFGLQEDPNGYWVKYIEVRELKDRIDKMSKVLIEAEMICVDGRLRNISPSDAVDQAYWKLALRGDTRGPA